MNIARQRQLRRQATPPEQAMWKLLRHFKSRGFHFRRQVALGPYFADFACHHAKIVFEVDGDTHAVGKGPEHDRRRTEYMQQRGFTIVRISNRDVLRNPEGVFHLIEEALLDSSATPTPDPSPQGGGEVPRRPND